MKRATTLAVLGAASLAPLLLLGGADNPAPASAGEAACLTLRAAAHTTLTAEQARNAATIVSVGAGRRLPPRAAVIALATALQESGLVNLPSGDRDSVGLFQQRPSQGWGSVAELRTPTYAAGRFYDALLAVPGWQTLPVTVAAQAVQRSANPAAYARWTAEATSLAGANTISCSPVILAGYSGTSRNPYAAKVIAFARSQLGMPYLWGGNGPLYDCSGLAQAAYRAAGLAIPRTSDAQYQATPHITTDIAALQPGDLVYFNPGEDAAPGLPGHVGIYVGGGRMIQDPHTGAVVTDSPVLDGDVFLGGGQPQP